MEALLANKKESNIDRSGLYWNEKSHFIIVCEFSSYPSTVWEQSPYFVWLNRFECHFSIIICRFQFRENELCKGNVVLRFWLDERGLQFRFSIILRHFVEEEQKHLCVEGVNTPWKWYIIGLVVFHHPQRDFVVVILNCRSQLIIKWVTLFREEFDCLFVTSFNWSPHCFIINIDAVDDKIFEDVEGSTECSEFNQSIRIP